MRDVAFFQDEPIHVIVAQIRVDVFLGPELPVFQLPPHTPALCRVKL
jgi:hypothetical protein